MSAHLMARFVAAALLILAVHTPAAHAQRKRTNPRDSAAARAAWAVCFPAKAPVPEFPDVLGEDASGSGREVKRTPAGFLIEAYDGGQGSEAVYSGITIDFQPSGCRALWARTSTYDGALAVDTRIGWINRDAPNDSELRALVAEPAKTDAASHAFARNWLSHACDGGPVSELEWKRPVEGPIAPVQAWHPGVPRQPRATFWSLAALDAIGMRAARWPATNDKANDDDDDDELNPLPPGPGPEIAGIEVPAIGPPKRTFSAAGATLFEAPIHGRNEGRAIALYDPRGDRHRWVVVTRGCVQGTTVKWVGAVGQRLIGVTSSWHGRYAEGDAILVIDVPTGTAWAVRYPDTIREVEDGKLRATLSGAKLALRKGRASSTVDLDPMLALIRAAR